MCSNLLFQIPVLAVVVYDSGYFGKIDISLLGHNRLIDMEVDYPPQEEVMNP